MRPMDRAFIDTFVRVGWEGIEQELHVHKTTVRRWIDEHDRRAIVDGRPLLVELRRAHLERQAAADGKRVRGRKPNVAKRYVLGRTLKRGQRVNHGVHDGGGRPANDS